MSNDLISRSNLLEKLRGNVLVDVTPELEKAIAEHPTAYDVDKVVEQLEKEKYNAMLGVNTHRGTAYQFMAETKLDAWKKAIEIVKSGGVVDE